MSQLARAIEAYIRAKDGNRPHLLVPAFDDTAELTMRVKTDQIAFPSAVVGREGIGDVLCSQFALRYENVYTFCIGQPPADNVAYQCGWLVCMTEKHTGAARVGYGQYDWRSTDGSGRVSNLEIVIEEMAVLPADVAAPLLAWAERLPYPWCDRASLRHDVPAHEVVQRIVGALVA